jgi:16S rRNA (guanine527-N7)-methyltransferase
MTGSWDRSAARRRLASATASLPLRLPEGAPEQLLTLCELLAAWAARISLTAHREPGAILDRLVLDALALAAAIPAASSIADLGSGAGFPGLPFAVIFPDRQVTLIEARERKHHFQREAVRRLQLENARPLLGRSDALAPEPHGLVVAQAMAKPMQALPQLLPWASPGAWLAIPGGEEPPPIGSVAGVEASEIRRYRVPLTDLPRTLWLGRRSAQTI